MVVSLELENILKNHNHLNKSACHLSGTTGTSKELEVTEPTSKFIIHCSSVHYLFLVRSESCSNSGMPSNKELSRLFNVFSELLLLHEKDERLAVLLSGAAYRLRVGGIIYGRFVE